MPIFSRENKFHFGIISQGQKEKLHEFVRDRDQKSQEGVKNELEECELLVGKFQSNTQTKRDITNLKYMINHKGIAREIQWCRFILMTRTPERDLCLNLLYSSIQKTDVDEKHIRNRWKCYCRMLGYTV